METTPAFRGLSCTDCGTRWDLPAADACPECDAPLVAEYDPGDLSPATFEGRPDDQYRFAELLPFGRDAAVSIAEGGTPLVACPSLADDLGVAEVSVKDEGRNPTGALTDRGLSVAASVAAGSGASSLALPSTGNGAQSAAAYAGRAGLDARGFVPSRCPFVNKAMVNVHGGEMDVVGGRYADALAAYREALATADVRPFPAGPASPYRREGCKTAFLEVAADREWNVPDAVVVPAGHGIAVAAAGAAFDALEAAGLTDATPRVYAAQSDGCAPLVAAHESGGAVEPVERPDTIAGPLEVPDPACGDLALDAVAATDGGAVAAPDNDALEAGVAAAESTGVELGATGGVAVAGAHALAADGKLGADESVVIVNPVAGSKESDLLRSHLMGQGI
ncbi:MAG: pyridoxal-phosphate dependent enzyme [Haloarculaceae archaeon]